MYKISVSRDFVTQHWLTVPDAGPEGECHSHHYGAELRLRGESLNEYGYLADIDDVTAALDDLVDRYRDATLNDLSEFGGGNPSLERFARILCDRFVEIADLPTVEAVAVALSEDDVATATYERPI